MAIPIIPAGDPQPPEPDPPYPSGSAPCSKSFSLLNPSEYPRPCGCGLSTPCTEPAVIATFDHAFSSSGNVSNPSTYFDSAGNDSTLRIDYEAPVGAPTSANNLSAFGTWAGVAQRYLLNPQQYNSVSADTSLRISVSVETALSQTQAYTQSAGAGIAAGLCFIGIGSLATLAYGWTYSPSTGRHDFGYTVATQTASTFLSTLPTFTDPQSLEITLDWTPGGQDVAATYTSGAAGVVAVRTFPVPSSFATDCGIIVTCTFSLSARIGWIDPLSGPFSWPPATTSTVRDFIATAQIV